VRNVVQKVMLILYKSLELSSGFYCETKWWVICWT